MQDVKEIKELGLRSDQSKFREWNRALKAGALGQPRGMDGEGGERGFQGGRNMFTRGWFMSIYGKNHHNIVK